MLVAVERNRPLVTEYGRQSASGSVDLGIARDEPKSDRKRKRALRVGFDTDGARPVADPQRAVVKWCAGVRVFAAKR